MYLTNFLRHKRSIAAPLLATTLMCATVKHGMATVRIKFSRRVTPISVLKKAVSCYKNSTQESFAADTIQTTLTFNKQNINTKSVAQTYTLRGSHLTEDITVITNSPFSISKDSIVYGASATYSVEELASAQKVYVRFDPTAEGTFSGNISNISNGADEKIVALSGTAVDPDAYFNSHKLVSGNILSPNGDGINDTWVIKNIEYYPDNQVKVFDRSNRVLYSKHGYTNDWNGTYNNSALSQGTYFFIIEPGAGLAPLRGFITITRD